MNNRCLLDNIDVPNIDITDWKNVFESLQGIGKNIIVEEESVDPNEGESEMVVGKVYILCLK